MKIELTKKQLVDRLVAIDYLTGFDLGLSAEEYSYLNPASLNESGKERLLQDCINFGKLITDCSVIAHGAISKCCVGRGEDLVKQVLEERNQLVAKDKKILKKLKQQNAKT
jgi:hypothetical protein